MKNRSTTFIIILSVFACFGLFSRAQAQEGDIGGGNTVEGFDALANVTTGGFNTAIGWGSLFGNTDAFFNTGVGAGTLVFSDGAQNTAVGAGALLLNTTGSFCNAVGVNALNANDSGFFNNAHGRGALFSNFDGGQNNAFGDLALTSNVSGSFNTGIGDDALFSCTGSSNTAVGDEAGNSITTGSTNVCIGAGAGVGIVDGVNIIAIGAPAVGPFANIGPTCFIGAIDGEPTSDAGSTVAVLIDSNNNLGTIVSSRRFKHDIKPMDKASEALLALKPVSFKYNYDRKGSTQYGLIAEEVAQVNPHLAVYRDGEPYTVKYDQINVMLLNEFLKEHKRVEEQQASISQLKGEMQTMVAQLKEQGAQIQKVSAQLEVNKPAPQVVVNKP
jgi:hypothetical protein